jgi:hypothetical protein
MDKFYGWGLKIWLMNRISIEGLMLWFRSNVIGKFYSYAIRGNLRLRFKFKFQFYV